MILDGQTAIKKGVTTSSFLSGSRRAVRKRRSHAPRGTALRAHNQPSAQGPLQPLRPTPHHSQPALGGQNGAAVNESVRVSRPRLPRGEGRQSQDGSRAQQKLAQALSRRAAMRQLSTLAPSALACERATRREAARSGRAHVVGGWLAIGSQLRDGRLAAIGPKLRAIADGKTWGARVPRYVSGAAFDGVAPGVEWRAGRLARLPRPSGRRPDGAAVGRPWEGPRKPQL